MSILFWVLAVIGALWVGALAAVILFGLVAALIDGRERRKMRRVDLLAVLVTEGDEDYIEWLEKTYWRKETA